MISGASSSTRRSRSAFTLLEVTLALAISLIILGGAYEVLNRQLYLAEIGRDLVEETALARVILDRMAADITASLGGVDPQQLPDISSDSTEALLQAETFAPLFNNGVEGTNSLLIIAASRVPRELLAADKRRLDSASLPKVSDLRRISYWFVDDGSTAGLCRQELSGVTSGDFDVKPPDVGDAATYLIAPEVSSVMFEFFDGVNWQSVWNGSSYAADGQTPLGPPSAIRVTLTVRSRDGLRTKDYRRTVALPAGNNFLSQQLGL
jgi:prepilin-type N-terminal cleavage/methylation domain-containing protein